MADDHIAVVEGVNIDVSIFLLQFKAVRVGVIEAVAVQDDSSTKRTCRFHLKDWGRCGHADDGVYAEFLRGICNSLCMITG